MLLTPYYTCRSLATLSNHCFAKVSGNPVRYFLRPGPKVNPIPFNNLSFVLALLKKNRTSCACHNLIFLLLITFSTMYPASYVQASSYYPTKADLRFLPSYCVARYNNDNPAFASKVNKWRRVFGLNTWISLHHYCQGINYVERAKRGANPKARQKDYEGGIENLTKHLEIYGPKFPIKAQTLYVIGTAYEGLNKLAQAARYYREAISIKPRFSRAYIALSDIFIEANNLSEAESVIQAGLKKSPKSKGLLNRKKKIQSLQAVE